MTNYKILALCLLVASQSIKSNEPNLPIQLDKASFNQVVQEIYNAAQNHTLEQLPEPKQTCFTTLLQLLMMQVDIFEWQQIQEWQKCISSANTANLSKENLALLQARQQTIQNEYAIFASRIQKNLSDLCKHFK